MSADKISAELARFNTDKRGWRLMLEESLLHTSSQDLVSNKIHPNSITSAESFVT